VATTQPWPLARLGFLAWLHRSLPRALAESSPPLVLLHGLWDTPQLFRHLRRELADRRGPLLVPQLPLRLGTTGVEQLASFVGGQIEAAFGTRGPLDLLGFSMGGVIARTWIQLLGGHARTRRFISVGSPQQGTLMAMPWPRWALGGIADLRWGSPLLERLNRNLEPLLQVECCSFYCNLDLMVVPGWRAVLPVGPRRVLPVWSHRQMMRHPAALKLVVEELLRP
jgi:triacylglycerol lipase